MLGIRPRAASEHGVAEQTNHSVGHREHYSNTLQLLQSWVVR